MVAYQYRHVNFPPPLRPRRLRVGLGGARPLRPRRRRRGRRPRRPRLAGAAAARGSARRRPPRRRPRRAGRRRGAPRRHPARRLGERRRAEDAVRAASECGAEGQLVRRGVARLLPADVVAVGVARDAVRAVEPLGEGVALRRHRLGAGHGGAQRRRRRADQLDVHAVEPALLEHGLPQRAPHLPVGAGVPAAGDHRRRARGVQADRESDAVGGAVGAVGRRRLPVGVAAERSAEEARPRRTLPRGRGGGPRPRPPGDYRRALD